MQSKVLWSLKFVATLVAAMSISMTAHAARTAKMETFENIPLETGSGKPLTLAQVKQTITTAAKSRDWSVKDSGASQVTATILVRGEFRVAVDIPYTTKEFSIKYVSSENLNYKETAKGPVIHANYNKWVKNLTADIRSAALGK